MIRYRQVALEDIAEVTSYSRGKFEPKAAAAYLDDLRVGIDMLERFPNLGHPIAGREDVRRFRRGRHFVYYLIDRFTDDLLVLSILHERQLPPSHALE